MAVITRDNQKVDVLYVLLDGSCFITPDGAGRYWYDSEEEAKSKYAFIERVEYVDGVSDW